MSRDKIYFASDMHLGLPDAASNSQRERQLVRWLQRIDLDAKALHLVGDLFDFWYEYRTVVPKGHTRLLGQLARLADAGVELHIYTGNHDMWMFSYFEQEFGAVMHRSPQVIDLGGKTLMVGHGDGLGPGDHGYKFIKRVFSNPVCIWLFGWLHPDVGIRLAQFWSGRSRESNLVSDQDYNGPEAEWLYQYCLEVLKQRHIDLFIFGHRHLLLDLQVGEHSRYINLGSWHNNPHYAVWDGAEMRLLPVGG